MSETERLPIYSSMYSTHSLNYVGKASLEVCYIMTLLGYGDEIRRRRIEKYREMDRLLNAILFDVSFITAGSKAEGLTGWFESDRDVLFVMKNAICVESEIDLQTIPEHLDVYKMDILTVYPGHCRLLHERPAPRSCSVLVKAMCDDGIGNILLSSFLCVDELSKFFGVGIACKTAGPAIHMSIDGGNLMVDLVPAIPCKCPSILKQWAERSRHWPQPDVVQKVVSLGAFVTPTGFKGSENKYIEWRICFNTSETELINNLNSTQVKLYVILKMIVKHILKPNNKEITSYVLKNIILWQAESNSPTMFQEINLFHWLNDALEALKTAISSTQLPYYMIPERNLMAACGLKENQQRKWVADITDMIEEGPRVILRLPKIRQAVIGYPEPLLWFSSRRLELEMLMLEEMNREYQCKDVWDVRLRVIRSCRVAITMAIFQRMRNEGGECINLNDILRRMLM